MGLSTVPPRADHGPAVPVPPGRDRRRDRWRTRWRERAAAALPRLAVASLVANVLIIATGGAVRLTASGLGCPTWPQCGGGRYVAHAEYGVHGAVEFGNRLLTFVLTAVVLATLVAALGGRRVRPGSVLPAVLLFAGIPVQAVIGGISVLTHLDPWVVTVHFVVSVALVAVAALLVLRTRPGAVAGPRRRAVPRPVHALALGVSVVVAAVVYAGTVVTGSGPHAGDLSARRTGLDPAAVSQLHADLVVLLLGLTVGLVVALAVLPAPPPGAVRAAGWLLGVEAAQGLIGAVQYATGLPAALVDLHLVGAALVVAATTWTVARVRGPAPVTSAL